MECPQVTNIKEMDGLYHCTKFESLQKILSSKYFRPSFCLEEASYLPQNQNMAFAVVCFADLRKYELRDHMVNFNSDTYIKMSKEWAMTKGVSPVIYYSDKYTLSSAVFRSILSFASTHKTPAKFFNSANLMMGLLKQYRGCYYLKPDYKDLSKEEVCFYLEREWRYLPIPKNGEAMFLPENDFRNADLRQEKIKELVDNGYPLSFGWDDIMEIGCSNDSSVRETIVDILMDKYNISEEEAKSKFQNWPEG